MCAFAYDWTDREGCRENTSTDSFVFPCWSIKTLTRFYWQTVSHLDVAGKKHKKKSLMIHFPHRLLRIYHSILVIRVSLEIKRKPPRSFWLHGLISYSGISISHHPGRRTEPEEWPAFLRLKQNTETHPNAVLTARPDRQRASRLKRTLMLPRQDITPFHGNEHLLISAKATAENLN